MTADIHNARDGGMALLAPERLARRVYPGVGRASVVAGLGALLVLPLGLSDGGYSGRSSTALAVALAAGAALALVTGDELHISRGHLATSVALGLLAGWVALSSLWARDGAAVQLETRRCVLYVVSFAAVGVVVGRRRHVFLLSLVAALSAVVVVAMCIRVASGVPVDPFYGGLLSEPVGYPNAVGVLAAVGIVVAIGLAQEVGERGARWLRSAATLMVLALGLTGSRGGALALAVGLVVLVILSARSERWRSVGDAATALVIGGGAWGLTVAMGGAGFALAIAAGGAAAIVVALPAPGTRRTCALVVALALAAAAALVVVPPAATSSFRLAYWAAALEEVRERPVLGSGAGSFHLTWLEHRTVSTNVRDAHSLYVETLSELGPIGLAVLLTAFGIPLGASVRRRGDSVAVSAAAGFAVFAVHAGLDWDWEMPVVTLVGLGCAAVVLISDADARNEST